eukprot:jgi/Tetstr1/432004/TSEL_021480.t1
MRSTRPRTPKPRLSQHWACPPGWSAPRAARLSPSPPARRREPPGGAPGAREAVSTDETAGGGDKPEGEAAQAAVETGVAGGRGGADGCCLPRAGHPGRGADNARGERHGGDAGSVLRESDAQRILVPFLTQFGTSDSWELAQKLAWSWSPSGIGSLAAARKFCTSTGFPNGKPVRGHHRKAAMALGFPPGLGRKGGELESLEGKVNGYVKLLLIYLGDKSAQPVFKTGSAVDLSWKRAFDVVGKGYQRPFELATLRGRNMVNILSNWGSLTPKDSNLLVQRGGVLLLQRSDGELSCAWRYDDPGILGYADIDLVMAKALAEDPAAFDPLAVLHRAADASAEDASEVTKAMAALERARGEGVTLAGLNGQWRLRFTTGNAGGVGAYFPLKAVQTFDAEARRLRNRVYLGPLSLYFDGGFVFYDDIKMLEFVFERVTLETGLFQPLSFKIGDDAWASAKQAEQAASGGRGNIGAAKEGRRGANPFFKFFLADAECCVARGRGGGLAMWKRLSDEPQLPTPEP